MKKITTILLTFILCFMMTPVLADNTTNEQEIDIDMSLFSASDLGLLWPVKDYYGVDSGFGYRSGTGSFHGGIDIFRPVNTIIYAAQSGTVEAATYHSSWGNYVKIKHNNTYSTLYAHMSSYIVSVGDYVQRGQPIGYVGMTGNAQGYHLHFEIYENGTRINPVPVNADGRHTYSGSAPLIKEVYYVYDKYLYQDEADLIYDLGTDFYAEILNTSSGKAIGVGSDEFVELESNNGSAKQKWIFTRQSDGSYKIASVLNGKVLDVHTAGDENGLKVHVYDDVGGNNQRWFLHSQGNGYVLRPKNSSTRVLDLKDGSTSNGTAVQIYERNNTNAQIFSIARQTLPSIPKPTLNVTVDTAANKNVKFTWKKVNNGDTYDIRIYQSNKVIDTIWSQTGTSYSCTLSPGTYKANVAAVNSGFLNYTFSDDISFTVKQSYTITYNANGGSGAPAAQTKVHGETLKLSSVRPIREGYTFRCWNTKANGSGTSYDLGGSYTFNSSVTLYAQWDTSVQTIYFDANEGSTVIKNKTVTYNASYGELPIPVRKGYKFIGWFTQRDGGTQVTAGTKVTITASQTLYAHWEHEPITEPTPERDFIFDDFTTKLDASWGDDEFFFGFYYKANFETVGCGLRCWDAETGKEIEYSDPQYRDYHVDADKYGVYSGCHAGFYGPPFTAYGLIMGKRYEWVGYIKDTDGNVYESETYTFTFTPEGSKFLKVIQPLENYSDDIIIETGTSDGKTCFVITAVDDMELGGMYMYVAEYTEDGKLISINEGESVYGENVKVMTADAPKSNNFKIFIWDYGMQPVTETQTTQ